MLEKRLLEMLRCPLGKSKLREEKDSLVCERCGVRFPVRDEIPVMLIHEAKLPEGIRKVEELPCQQGKNNTFAAGE